MPPTHVALTTLLGSGAGPESLMINKKYEQKAEKTHEEHLKALGRRKFGPPPAQAESEERECGVTRWLSLLVQLRAWGAGIEKDVVKRMEAVENALEAKAPATILKRAGSMTLLVDWLTSKSCAAWPLNQDTLVEYSKEAGNISIESTESARGP